jgi:uncharacterized protein YdeI (YjbR/CyaY-like superfamily)
MSSNSPKTLRVVLEQVGVPPRWVIARIPLDLKKAWPGWRGRRVLGEINGFAFRTALFPVRDSPGFALLVNKQMQSEGKARPGDTVRIRLEPDLAEPIIEVPSELKDLLKSERRLRRWFDALSPSMRKGISAYVDKAKGAETRIMRAEKMAESLMLAMEGEQAAPPILRAAFQRQPLAQRGWEAMTSSQRRNHLLGIFYVQTVDGRERRVAKAIDECLRVAQKKRGDSADEFGTGLNRRTKKSEE